MSLATQEAQTRNVWLAYVGLVTVGYLTYGLGAAGPHLRSDLGLSNMEIGLHSSALALGLAGAGVLVADLGRRFGERTVRAVAIGLLGIALVLLAGAPTLEATLTSAALIGFGAGALLGYANAALGAAGGKLARLRLARGHIGAMMAAAAVPLALAVSASVGPGWWLGLLPAAVLLGAIAFALRAAPVVHATDDVTDRRRLPPKFWLAWLFLAAVIAVEFSIVFWGATLVQLRTDLTIPGATAVGALFFAGMLVGRVGLATGLGAGPATRRSLAVGLALTAVGTGLAWVSTSHVLSAVALFIAGLGVSVLYPLGAAVALAAAPAQAAIAGNRLTLATGLAILVAPFLLGTLADASGIVPAWGLVLGLVAIACGLVLGLS